MDRKKFIQNILGTIGAVTIGKYVAPIVSNKIPTEVGVMEQLESSRHNRWMDAPTAKLVQDWNREKERCFWYRDYKT